MKTPHKHAEIIKAWAEGAEIEYRCAVSGDWEPANCPGWADFTIYRIKPEPKPDVVRYTTYQYNVNNSGTIGGAPTCDVNRFTNLKLIFDGETGKLKAAEVL